MPQVEKLLVFLASPGDVPTERRYVEEIAADLNRTVASDKDVVLQVVSWENDAYPGYGQDAQALIDRQIAEMSKYALFVGIMWNRLGTPTPRAASGTVEEFERAVHASKQNGQPDIWFYFRESASKMDTEEQLEQRKKVLSFKKEVQANGMPWTYRHPSDFRDKFRKQMILWLNERTRTLDSGAVFRDKPKDGSTTPPGVEQPKPKLEPGIVFRDTLADGSRGPEMVVIPVGTFQMGDIGDDGKESERPVHLVRIIRPFAIGRYEVTFEEYDQFAAATVGQLPDDTNWHDKGWGRGQRPVINVSLADAMEYANWLSEQTSKRYRLPTEAEWEYAARGGGKEERWAGTSREDELGEYAWYSANSGDKTQPVGGKKPNDFGLYDMSGNVYEWVQDWYHYNYEGAPADGRAWLQRGTGGQRVIRGGCYSNDPKTVRSAFRSQATSAYGFFSIGFRLARDID